MKLRYAKLWLKKYIKYNHANLDENKLNRAIINLSHRVYKSHGLRGHNTRQSIRGKLVDYSKLELARYNVEFGNPLQVRFKQRAYYAQPMPTSKKAMILVKAVVLLIIGYAVLYLLLHLH